MNARIIYLAAAAAFSTNIALAQHVPDPLISAIATLESVAKAREIEAYTLGTSTYLWKYPLVYMERVMREYIDVKCNQPATSYRAPLNRIGWA